jgi:hypothetical protein
MLVAEILKQQARRLLLKRDKFAFDKSYQCANKDTDQSICCRCKQKC